METLLGRRATGFAESGTGTVLLMTSYASGRQRNRLGSALKA